MNAGPVEILVLVFPESEFNGSILPELGRLVDAETITIVDGLFVHIEDDGTAAFVEFDELGSNPQMSALSSLIESANGLISDEDVFELTDSLETGASAAILVFEHTWAKPLRDAIVSSGGIMLDSIRVPGPVVDEVLATVAALA